ncbi:MAG: aldolase [Clostridia bacterium]|nr:aldolase [Clostridia bacterium]
MIRPYLKRKIENKDALVVGTHIEMTDSICSEVLGRVGFDFVLVAADSSENGYSALRNHMTALHSGGTPTVVRVESNLQSHVSRVLELGPDGIIFPAVNTAEQAKNVVSQCLYPPAGRRRYSPLRAVGYGLDDAMRFVREDSVEMCRFIQLDSAESLRNLPDILEVDMIDGFFFSPGELLRHDGTPDGLYGPDTAVLLREAAALLGESGKPFGVSVLTAGVDVLKFWVELGATIIASGTDFGYILDGASGNLKDIREL